ncbi:MAG: type 4a pilus biogenesis protein PilO [Actinomycetota bacterium]|jgi:Tfp pilus assembly protein PilO|nr:type 4a pilus biogenesis protein PilO [Actinomycetota bacterium]
MKIIYKAVIIVLIVIAITAVLLLWFLPSYNESQRILREINSNSQQKIVLEDEINDLLRSRSNYYFLNALFEKYNTEIPLSDSITVLTDQIYEIGKYSGILIESVDFKEIDESTGKKNEINPIGTINVNVSVSGSYYQVLTFLNTIEIMPRLIKVENISLDSQGVYEIEDLNENILDISALINFKAFYDKTDYVNN